MGPELEQWHKLFDIVKVFVYEAGGDGDGFIIAPDYQKLADAFEKYENNGDKYFVRRHEVIDGAISFSFGQEGITFLRDRTFLPNWAGEITIETLLPQ